MEVIKMRFEMSLETRKELLAIVQKRYQQANWLNKRKILDGIITTTGYRRKYAITLLNRNETKIIARVNAKRLYKKKYDEAVRQALLTIWHAANQICSKRLVPFIPDLIAALERFGHLSLPMEVRKLLLSISTATVDRLLETKRQEGSKGMSTTRPGSLLKRQIKIRTFADWDDVVPGFLEGDLVAHCGDRGDGSFLNTLVLTDIASTWTEFFPLLRKSEADVIAAVKVAQQILPFSLIGLDTDNGSEFINYALLDFCKTQKITFTRSRAYKKNDQAHVEEKNGSIVRRLIGYDRYDGLDAYNSLSELYAVLRLYVNFFQPSLKLISKKRDGAKVTKKYDVAKTPYQRILASTCISEDIKKRLKEEYDCLDPLGLLRDLEKLQDKFWKHAWKTDVTNSPALTDQRLDVIDEKTVTISALTPDTISPESCMQVNIETNTDIKEVEAIPCVVRRYRHSDKPRKKAGPRTWRTRKDPFQETWSKLRLQLELNPERTAKNLLDGLINERLGQLNINTLRTLQRRVAGWRLQQIKIKQEKNKQLIVVQHDMIGTYVSLVGGSVTK